MSKIIVFLNGKPRQISDTTTLSGLIKELNLDPKMILVEHNGKALLRTEWAGVSPRHGDRMEFVRVVAGG